MTAIELETAPVTDPLEQIPVLPEEPKTREQILLGAANLIEQKGWGHGSPSLMGFGGYCLAGAVVTSALGKTDGTLWQVGTAERLLGVPYTTIYKFNDRLWWASYAKISFFDVLLTRPADYRLRQGRKRVVGALRAMAAGKTWEEATS